MCLVPLVVSGASCSRSETPSSRGEVFNAGPVFWSDTPVLEHTFQIVNRSRRLLKILEETHSCSCTQVEIGSRSIAPGAKTAITLRVNVPPGYGDRSVLCHLTTDDPATPNRSYEIRLTSYPRVSVVPAKLEFGTITAEDESVDEKTSAAGGRSRTPLRQRAWVELYRPPNRDRPPSPKVFSLKSDVTVELGRVPMRDVLPDGVLRYRYPLDVVLTAGKRPAKMYVRDVAIPFEDDLIASLQVIWKQAGSLSCMPSSLAFGMAEVGDSVVKKGQVRVASYGGATFRILGVDSGSPAGAVMPGDASGRFPTASAEVHELRFELTPPAEGSRVFSGQAVVKTDDPRSPEVRIPWSLFLRRHESQVSRAGE